MSDSTPLSGNAKAPDQLSIEGVSSANGHPNPIRGYPELHWAGKRPGIPDVLWVPAEERERYGEPTPLADGLPWMNRLYWGDNLQVMAHLLKEFREKVQLIYIDPPFDSKADYKKSVVLRGAHASNDHSPFEEKQYADMWSGDDYLQFMYERLQLLRQLLAPTGSIYLHCDWRRSHHLRMQLDEIFGAECFQASIAWRTMTSSGYKGKKSLGRSHAVLHYYSKTQRPTYNPVRVPMSDEMRARYFHDDGDGRLYKDSYLGDVTDETLEELKEQNLVYWTRNGTPRIKHYLDEAQGLLVDDVWADLDDVWIDVDPVNSQSANLTGYPTQKPDELLERIIKISSDPGDLVFDAFMGSGTTQAVAMRLGRRFLGCDINRGAMETAIRRLVAVAADLNSERSQMTIEDRGAQNTRWTGFTVNAVAEYDFFRNAEQARDTLKQLLELEPLESGDSMAYDGRLEMAIKGRRSERWLVKILNVQGISTRADLKDLLTPPNLNDLLDRQRQIGSGPCAHLLLVTLGHEPELETALANEWRKLGLIVDVVASDIVRERKDIVLRRPSEARVSLHGRNLRIEGFYPFHLLHKLSLDAREVGDWRETVAGIAIDCDYDGAILNARIIDAPAKKSELVKGEYELPEGHGAVAVKITDVLDDVVIVGPDEIVQISEARGE